jgi:short-subunit dehydrogenase
LQIAHALGEAATVVLSSRSASNLKAAARDLTHAGIEADWIAADGAHKDDALGRRNLRP